MNWSDLFAFMTERDPAFADTLVGANPEDVETAQRELGIVFPTAYVDFLTTMGVETGRYHPFGRGMDTNFYRVLQQIPAEDYDVQEYFLIAKETDSSRCPMYDIYLDMRKSSDESGDGRLVQVEDNTEWVVVEEVRLTLLERLTEMAWLTFEAARHAFARALYIHAEDPNELDTLRTRALELLAKQGQRSTLPAQHHLDCLGSSTEASFVMLQPEFRLIHLDIMGNDEDRVARLTEVLLDYFPGSAPDKRMPSITNP